MSESTSIDLSRPSPVLELAALTRSELSALTKVLRNAQHDMDEAGVSASFGGTYGELLLLRIEVRAIFLDRLAREA